jgi:hypothetical protein
MLIESDNDEECRSGEHDYSDHRAPHPAGRGATLIRVVHFAQPLGLTVILPS